MDKVVGQYLDLYSQNKDLIRAKSAPGFNRLREEAYRNLSVTGLPSRGSENFEITDICDMLAPDFGVNIARLPLDLDPSAGFKCGLPNLSSSLFFMLGDRWGESAQARINLPEGVEIGPLSSFLGDNGEAGEFYGRLADMSNPLVALNSMLVQEGVYIRVKRGIKVSRPVQIVNLLEGLVPLMAFRRLLVILEEGAELKMLSCDHCGGSQPMASLTVGEIFVSRGALFDFYDMEESGPESRRMNLFYVNQEEKSDVLMESFTLHNGKTRNEFHCSLKGENAYLRLCGLGVEGSRSSLDNYSHIRHEVPRCTTEELFKYIIEDDARGAFTGRIYVAPGAVKTEAYQSNRNLVTSPRARVFSKPQLEIYNDDVKCSHGSATGQLDAMQLFYMRQRGLSDEEARHLLKQAFMADVIDSVRLPLLKDRLHTLIERRFNGQDTTCGDCDICR